MFILTPTAIGYDNIAMWDLFSVYTKKQTDIMYDNNLCGCLLGWQWDEIVTLVFNFKWYHIIINCLRLVNHFFFRPRWSSGPCVHSGKSWWCPVWTLWIWLSNDSHFIFMVSPSPLGVEATHQYKWFMMLCCHFPTSSQFICFATASNFLRTPVHVL